MTVTDYLLAPIACELFAIGWIVGDIFILLRDKL